MSCRVIFRSSALTDIDDAYQWYEQQQPGLGDSFMAELGKVEALLGDNAMMFGRIRGEVRRAILDKFPYGVFYIARSEFVSIIAVLHQARNPRVWQIRG